MEKEFLTDLERLQKLSDKADKLQKQFCAAAEEFRDKYKNGIFSYPGEETEWALYHISPWNHSFRFDLYRISKKDPAATTKENKYIHIDKFSNMNFKNETLEERKKTVN